MGWQELMLIVWVAVPYYFLWRMIRNRGASYWWLLLGAVLTPPGGLLVGYFLIPRRNRPVVTDRPKRPLWFE